MSVCVCVCLCVCLYICDCVNDVVSVYVFIFGCKCILVCMYTCTYKLINSCTRIEFVQSILSYYNPVVLRLGEAMYGDLTYSMVFSMRSN